MSEYADRDIMELDEIGGYYIKHVLAMTGEKLHSKSDIAAELAHRDMIIDRLKSQLSDRWVSVEKDGLPDAEGIYAINLVGFSPVLCEFKSGEFVDYPFEEVTDYLPMPPQPKEG